MTTLPRQSSPQPEIDLLAGEGEMGERIRTFAHSDSPQAGETATPPHPSTAGQRILVVEDHADLATMLAAMLEIEGHQVQIADDGPSALTAAQSFEPQIILCDIGLPSMSGYEVAEHVRAQPNFARTPLIALTGYSQEEARQRVKEAGFDYHLIKPVEPEKLYELLQELCELKWRSRIRKTV